MYIGQTQEVGYDARHIILILILTATRLFPAQSTYRLGATPF